MAKIITLTTDFGLQDHYVGVIKGVILSINPEAKIVDINHNICSHSIKTAAFTINNSYKYFPKGSVHVVVVDPGVGGERRPMILVSEDIFFVGPDNGVFSLIINQSSSFKCYEINNPKYLMKNVSSTFHGRDIFAPTAAYISLGKSPRELGKIFLDPKTIDFDTPAITDQKIVGKIIYADKFGNLITNINSDLVGIDDVVKVGDTVIGNLSNSYSSGKDGILIAVNGSSGYLEIAVNKGSALEKLGQKETEVSVLKKWFEF